MSFFFLFFLKVSLSFSWTFSSLVFFARSENSQVDGQQPVSTALSTFCELFLSIVFDFFTFLQHCLSFFYFSWTLLLNFSWAFLFRLFLNFCQLWKFSSWWATACLDGYEHFLADSLPLPLDVNDLFTLFIRTLISLILWLQLVIWCVIFFRPFSSDQVLYFCYINIWHSGQASNFNNF